uniref:ABC transporter, permease protein n=1 Tax=Rheinheimera sp. BAL341 TaxID=1708203 RepID=A0A486XPC3_9GAMM
MKDLIKYYLRILGKDKVYTAINMTGLALGVACFTILSLYLVHDLTYDKHHANQSRIYRVNFEWSSSTSSTLSATSSAALGPLLSRTLSDVESYVHFRKLPREQALIQLDRVSYYEDDIYVADDNVFDIFDFEIVAGNRADALTNPNTIVVNRSFAKRYFGEHNPVGQTIMVDGISHKISLVFEDLKDNSHFKYQALIANAGNQIRDNNTLWSLGDGFTYVLLSKGNESLGYHRIFEDFFEKHMTSITRSSGGYYVKLFLEPLADIHLYSTAESDLPRGQFSYIYAFATVALFMLLVACINYINLATAQAAKRNKEISIRKILGASRGQLMLKFMIESMIFAFSALIIGILVVQLVLNFSGLESLIGKELELDITNPLTWVYFLLFGLGLGLVSGVYPAIYLSTMAVSQSSLKSSGGKFRQLLVLLQFTVSISIIIVTLLMFSQVQYMSEKSLGFEKYNRINIDLFGADIIEKLPTLQNEIKKYPGDLQTAKAIRVPWYRSYNDAVEVSHNGQIYSIEVSDTNVGENFLSLMGMTLLAGRDLEPQRDRFSSENNTGNVLVNEAFLKATPWNDALGKSFKIGKRNYNIVGVVKDFHFQDFHHAIRPFVLHPYYPDFADYSDELRANERAQFLVKLDEDKLTDSYKFIEDTFTRFEPNRPFSAKFVDETINDLYVDDRRLMVLIGIFACISVVISCLGLFGLTAFTTERKAKEISVRKILGATPGQLIFMLFKQTLILVVIGALVASFASYFGIQVWLREFKYYSELNFVVFPASAIFTLVVAFVTVYFQANKALNASPVEAIRND